MKNIKSTSLTLIATASLLASVSFNSSAMDIHTENALVDVCKTAMHNNTLDFKKTVKSYRMNNKTVALKVMCNGDDITEFAEKHGAYKTAALLERSVGAVSITDVAAITKINVTFKE